ncbi:MAG: serine protease, partial [Chloroflexota bacterium]
MKKLLLLLIAALVILPGVVLAQTDSLSRAEINRISDSVVLVLALDSNGNPFASGSGTIIDSTGIIYTNRHVVADGSDFAILTLDSVGEPAKLAYYATPILIHPDVDFAELQIDRDADGNPINAKNLNLPVIALATSQAEIGDRIFVFGYPSLGDAHLVMTSGSVTTIENDTLNGARIPYWYQTDA